MSADAVPRHPDEIETTQQQTTLAASSTRLEIVLGLRCLSIVLSYLDECEGTSFLLSQKNYWTDTILPLLRAPQVSSNNAKAKNKKNRHIMSGRNHKPLIKIPDASTRLERLNTRRWNKRQQQKGECQNIDCENNNDNNKTWSSRSLAALAKDEWNETVTNENDNQQSSKENDNHRRSIIMNPPLLQFYNDTIRHNKQRLFGTGTTCLASYPRSGNTLLRSLLETVTGFVTSSDTRPDRNLSIALAEKPPYFVGEGLAPKNQTPLSAFLTPRSKSCRLQPPPICKTHWPERIGCHIYDCQRVILLVRNPFDATDSYWHMNLTNTHTEKVAPNITEEHRDFYESLVKHEILNVWISFLDYYWKECSKHKVPLLFVRYEDLVLNPRDELQRILQFSCQSSSEKEIKSDWWKNRLEEVTKDANSDSKKSSGGEKRKTDNYGYRSSSSATDALVQEGNPVSPVTNHATTDTTTTSPRNQNTSSKRSSHPSIGRSLRRGMFPETLLRAIHDFDETPQRPREHEFGGKWLETLGYHVYKQGFPNNLDQLPPLPVLDFATNENCGSLTINVQDVSLELRPRDSPYGRKMRQWRRQRTANDTQPFPII